MGVVSVGGVLCLMKPTAFNQRLNIAQSVADQSRADFNFRKHSFIVQIDEGTLGDF